MSAAFLQNSMVPGLKAKNSNAEKKAGQSYTLPASVFSVNC